MFQSLVVVRQWLQRFPEGLAHSLDEFSKDIQYIVETKLGRDVRLLIGDECDVERPIHDIYQILLLGLRPLRGDYKGFCQVLGG